MGRAFAVLVLFTAALGLTGLGLTGCTEAVRSASVEASRSVVPIVVDKSLESFEDPATRARVQQILGTPEMQAAIRETARAVVLGMLEPESEASIQAAAGRLTDTVAAVLANDLHDKIIPASVDGMRSALAQSLSAEDERALARAVNSVVAQATGAAIRSASDELPRTLGPAMRTALVDGLNSPELRQAVDGVISDATRSALLSSRDLIIELKEHPEGPGPLVQLVDRVQRLLVAAIVATFVVGTLLGSLLVMVLRYRRGGGGWGRGPRAGSPAPSEASSPAGGTLSESGRRDRPAPA